MKKCRVCKQLKGLDSFSSNKDRSDGLSNLCKPCDQAKGRAWYAANKEKRAKTLKAWSDANSERIAGYTASYRQRHPERVAETTERLKGWRSEYGAAWYQANLDSKRERNRQWAKNNPAAHLALCARRRASVRKRYPTWADDAAIAEIYEQARRLTHETGIKHEVDHILPLNGKTVSGLHVHNNLRVITAVENRRKSARLIEALA